MLCKVLGVVEKLIQHWTPKFFQLLNQFIKGSIKTLFYFYCKTFYYISHTYINLLNQFMGKSATETPCIGVCSTIYGDEVCRGCKRFYHEIIDWNSFDDQRKLTILRRLETIMADTVGQYIQVVDVDLLKAKCEQFSVKYRPEFLPLCWAYELLKAGADKIRDLSKYGVVVHKEFQDLPLPKLFEAVDEAIYQQAQVVYQRRA